MKSHKGPYSWTPVVAMIAIALISCTSARDKQATVGRNQAPLSSQSSQPQAPAVAGKATSPIREPVLDAEVVYAEGTVESSGADHVWKPIDIGDSVPRGNSVRTGAASSCVVKFAYLGAVRIAPLSLATIESLVSNIKTSGAVHIGLNAGTIVCKVKKLTEKDSFEVTTQVAVCSVRGTEFMVSADSSGAGINVAVADGAVAILPSGFDTIKLRESADSGSKAVNQALASSTAALVGVSPVIQIGQEARIEAKAISAVNKAYERLIDRVEPLAQGSAPSTAEVSTLTRDTVTKLSELSVQGKDLSVSSKAELSEIHDVKLDTPPAPAPQAEVQLQPSRSIVIETEPADAAISLLDRYVANGRYEGSFDRAKSYVFTVAKSGYASANRVVEPSEGDQNIRIVLEPLTQSFDLTSDPLGATVYVAGNLIGTTPCSISGKTSQTLSLSIKKPGYVDFSGSVSLDGNAPKSVKAALEPVPVAMSFVSVPPDATITVDGTSRGVGSCVVKRAAGAEVSVMVSAPGYLQETRRYTCGGVDAAMQIKLASLKEVGRTKVSSSPINALTWYGDELLYVDGAGTLGALRIEGDYGVKPAWTLATKNGSMDKYQLQVRNDIVSFAGSAEWISLLPETGKLVARENVSGEFASLTGRPGLMMDAEDIRPMTNGLSIRRGSERREMRFPEGSLMYPTAYGAVLLIADSFGTVYFIDPQNATVEDKVATKVRQSFETGFLIDGSRGYFAGKQGDVACIDLDKRSVVWQSKIQASSGSTFLYDIQDCGSLLGLYSRGRMYFLTKNQGAPAISVIGDLSARPWVDAHRVLAPTSGGPIVEYSLPGGQAKRSITIGGAIASVVPIPTPIPLLAVGLKDGTLILYNPEGER